MAAKPTIPSGTRDFGPVQVRRRNYIFDTIREVFVRYGYQPIETPAMEQLATLTGKYGEEGDKLLFKILNSGDYLKDAPEELLQNRESNKLVASLAEKGLRYDLTVPFARFVVMRQHEITLPFKRYQIQPVWRADRPQKGRYREFFQCDADVVGSGSLMYEAELMQIFDEVFSRLNLRVNIRINNRKILAGMAEAAGIPESLLTDMTVAIDKLDKIGMEGVTAELAGRGISAQSVEKIAGMLQEKDRSAWRQLLADSPTGQTGLDELDDLSTYLTPASGLQNQLTFDPTLARGLNYYTGCIFEVEALDFKMGSIASGGRYDNLTGIFGLPGVSGVGISFGADRIYDLLEQGELFPAGLAEEVKILLAALDDATHRYAFQCLTALRRAGIAAELYPEPAKLKKPFKYADDRRIPFVAVVGSEEMETGLLAVKNLASGEQTKQSTEDLIRFLDSWPE